VWDRWRLSNRHLALQNTNNLYMRSTTGGKRIKKFQYLTWRVNVKWQVIIFKAYGLPTWFLASCFRREIERSSDKVIKMHYILFFKFVFNSIKQCKYLMSFKSVIKVPYRWYWHTQAKQQQQITCLWKDQTRPTLTANNKWCW